MGFTLIELLVVILIILLVSAVALPVVVSPVRYRRLREGARTLQGALVGARDKAIHDGRPCGIRLLPDPTYPLTWTSSGTINPYTVLAYDRILPLDSVPAYGEGRCTPIPPMALAWGPPLPPYPISPQVSFSWSTPPVLMQTLILTQSLFDPDSGQPNAPTSWFWNIRVGDKLRLDNAGPWYTIIGPMTIGPSQGNTDMFVNAGRPGPVTGLPVPRINGQPVEYLVLVNGQDDNKNGWIDEGNDGVDNDANGLIDDSPEQEVEAWAGTVLSHAPVNLPYTIRRQPAPGPSAREVALPAPIVIDATGNLLTQERSRLPVNRFTGCVDVLLNPDGTVMPTLVYSSPSSFGMNNAFYHFWLAERTDLADVSAESTGTFAPPLLPIGRQDRANGSPSTFRTLEGGYGLVTLFTRTGEVLVSEAMPFDDPVAATSAKRPYNVNMPFANSQEGAAGS